MACLTVSNSKRCTSEIGHAQVKLITEHLQFQASVVGVSEILVLNDDFVSCRSGDAVIR